MNTYISMLRGINVSGQKRILMADLKTLYESLGLTRVRTYVQSGNVLFDSPLADPAEAIAQIETAIQRTFGFEVPVLVRTAADLGRVIAINPFLPLHCNDTAHLYVHFLSAEPEPERVARLVIPANETGQVAVIGKEIFLFLPDGAGRTKLTNAFLESKLNVIGTARNWNTVNALLELARQ